MGLEFLSCYREKYERKIEKLMLFIFSIMQYSSNSGPKSLGPSETAKCLETGGIILIFIREMLKTL